MQDATPGNDQPQPQPRPPASVAAIVRDALATTDLPSANEAAASLLQARADNGTLEAHMADGALRSLADDLIRTCQEVASDED